ncbi:unnamed protein product [Boreogadus saida]
MSSSPSRETVGGPEQADPEQPDSADCVSLNTVVSAKTDKTLLTLLSPPQSPESDDPDDHHDDDDDHDDDHHDDHDEPKAGAVALVPPGSSHTLPRRAHSFKSPSVASIKSLADCSFMYTSPRDALGYATLKRLQQQRIHPSMSHSEALASPAKDVLFTDAITMKTGSLDSRLTPRRLSDRRQTCADPCTLEAPYRRLSRTLGGRWVGPASRRPYRRLSQAVYTGPEGAELATQDQAELLSPRNKLQRKTRRKQQGEQEANIGSSNWGLNLLQEENVIPDILAMAHDTARCCSHTWTRQGLRVLKQHGWDAVRHSRRTQWPVTPEEVDAMLTSELSSVPSTLSLNSESTSSRHNSESESQPSMYIMDDDKCDVLEHLDESSYLRCKPAKERSPFTILASTRFVRNRLINSLSLPSKKLRSTSDPKMPSGSHTPTELKMGMRRNRTVTEPSVFSSSQSDVFTPMFNGRAVPKSPTVSLETSFVGTRGGSEEQLSEGRLTRGGGSSGGLVLGVLGAGHAAGDPPPAGGGGVGGGRDREQSSRERLAGGDGVGGGGGSTVGGGGGGGVGGGGGGGGGTQFKSRSQSFNTDTTTSGISSMSSSPSRETVGGPEQADPEQPDSADCVSLNTVVSAKTDKTLLTLLSPPQSPESDNPDDHHDDDDDHDDDHHDDHDEPKAGAVALVPPGSSHTLPRRAHSFKSPSVASIKKPADCSFMPLASPAKDVLFTDAITMKTGSLDSRLTPRRFLKALSFASLDKEELLSPINQSTLQRCSSVRSMVSSVTYGCSDDYIGLALPVCISDMFHVRDAPYFQQRASPPSEERKCFLFGDGDERPPIPVLRQQFSISELIACRGEGQSPAGGDDSGLQEHTEDNCLYCVGAVVMGFPAQLLINGTHSRTDYVEFASWSSQSGGHRLEAMLPPSFSGGSGCSDAAAAAASQGSVCSTPTPGDVVVAGRALLDDAPACRPLLRKEVLRLIVNLSSSVGTKGHETGLLTIKEKFPYAFDDICLYSEVSHLLAHCMFRLASRRFIQELFQDVHFMPMYEEADAILTKAPKAVEEDADPEAPTDDS